jgi:hypothetical protein
MVSKLHSILLPTIVCSPYGIEAAGGAVTDKKSAVSRLEEAADLRSKGLISEPEYAGLKSNIFSAPPSRDEGAPTTEAKGGCSGFAIFTVIVALILPVWALLSVGAPYSSALRGFSDTGLFCVAVGVVVLPLIFFYLYFLPSFLAFKHGHPNRVLILVLNLLLGVTVLGWAILLIWATRSAHLSDRNQGGESGMNVFVNDRQVVQTYDPAKDQKTSPTSELETIAALQANGSITSDEYTKLKNEILSRV